MPLGKIMNSQTLRATFFVAALSIAISGCSKKRPESLPPPPGAQSLPEEASGSQIYPGSQADFQAQMSGQDVIFFDADRFNIDNIDQAALQTQAQWLRRYTDKRARIEGHADERGTRDYNLALGERRANAAKNYLQAIGIDASRLSVVSFGKERPAALGSDEASWSKNRRAVTVTVD